jgi:hypothetical protein
MQLKSGKPALCNPNGKFQPQISRMTQMWGKICAIGAICECRVYWNCKIRKVWGRLVMALLVAEKFPPESV